ncbi:hypothetical protein ACFSB1_10705 [Halopseudomonas phragmitis]|uniref:Uncharacterized protein n=1 Tax=Halopseudomonas phragmitis TaxID=1931241 RepID=A0A1V0B9T9_9GAMM|nr:hypothetical protein [Halopseudomonas phragmitis]AQZ96554.1 hypothetical protein BVH74_18150 [Halopseudomonas phragmitis]
MSNLNILFPEPGEVVLAGKPVKLKPVTLEHFELYGQAAAELMGLLSNANVQQINRYAATHAGQLQKVLAVTTDLSWWQRKRLPATVAVQLLVAVVAENAGFFGEALPAMVDKLNGAKSFSD